MNYFDFGERFVDEKNIKFKGISFNLPNFFKYKKKFRTHIINNREEFRSDIIAYNRYGDDNLSWVIDEINQATDFSFYTRGKEVYYLQYDILIKLGVV